MDGRKEVIRRLTIPTDPQENFNYNAGRLVAAAAAAQPYSYMLESSAEYSCIVIGEAILFFWIKADNSNTLYYHLAEPKKQVHAGNGLGFQHPLTAIGQLLSFILVALQSTSWNERWRNTSIQKAQTWSEDWEEILRTIPREERKLDSPLSAFRAPRYPIYERSPCYLRKKEPKSYRSSCNPESERTRDDPAEGSGDGLESINIPSKGGSASRSRGENRQRGTQGSPARNQRR